MEQIKHFNKLQENEIQNEIRNSILNNKTYVEFCNYEYYENNGLIKYNLHTIPIRGNIVIVDHGLNISGNGKPYASKILESPTWFEICKIANDLIITTAGVATAAASRKGKIKASANFFFWFSFIPKCLFDFIAYAVKRAGIFSFIFVSGALNLSIAFCSKILSASCLVLSSSTG
ncbi:hypothetical protein AGLY_011574 [Aphis glycines]|uniref:Uncharacterized protein n=1 Tax=Aphis glycines TaxID=307491 RepID=A0A6G0TE50_APHGL|nr:hypothetical protein AGLY_011574 [Aphis glycines]